MNVKEMLQIVDQWVFHQTDQHLDDLQKKIIEEISQGKTYKQIADLYGYNEGYIGDESRKLFKILSEKLGEDVNKNNFIWTIERVINSQFVNFGTNHINSCHNHEFSNNHNGFKSNQIKLNKYDLTLAPQILKFYNRETELKTLYNWIFKGDQPFTPTRLISVLGLSGIGKTYLVKRFIDLNLDQFEVIIWKTLKFPKSLDLLVNDILKICKVEIKENLEDKLNQLFTLFKEQRCLIILDDLQNIFIKSQLAGQYQAKFQNYQDFFIRIIETEHQSNLILISQEECVEMSCFDQELYPVKSLNLLGLDDINILKNTGLTDEVNWLKLINLYEGNFFYLKTITMLINKNYDGQVTEFLTENCATDINRLVTVPMITPQMQCHFQGIFNNLSSIEQTIILQLSKSENPILREELRQSLNLSSLDFNNGLQSLQQRYLVIKIKEEKIMFKLSSIFREYVNSFFN